MAQLQNMLHLLRLEVAENNADKKLSYRVHLASLYRTVQKALTVNRKDSISRMVFLDNALAINDKSLKTRFFGLHFCLQPL